MIRSEITGSVAVLTLDRPDRRNALGTELVRALDAALEQCDADAAVRAIVITGAPPAFCAGSDLKELAARAIPAMAEHEAETAAAVRKIGALKKPVVAAVDGYALGGGFMLAIGCDVVVSGAGATWHLPETPNGWIPIWGLGALMSRVGPVRARLLAWGAETIDGSEAQRLGVVDYLAADGEALAKAITVAERLAALPPEAAESVKGFFRPFAQADAERLDALACEIFARDCASDAAQATMRKFAPK